MQGEGVWNRKEENRSKGLKAGKLCKEKEFGTGRRRIEVKG
jgi:hypothetical protein